MEILKGIRVLDFGRYIAGPFCGALLGDLGADVIRIEKVSGSEDRFNSPVNRREQGSSAGEPEVGSLFLHLNRNKRGMTFNPKKPGAAQVLTRLVESADVVLANLPPDGLQDMGLDYASLVAIKPDIILASSTAYGDEGSFRNRVGFDGVAQAMSGNMDLTGEEGAPTRNYFPYVDFMTGALNTVAIQSALMHRQQTGEGQEVKGALLASALTIAGGGLIEQAITGINRVATLNRGQTAAPSDTFKTRDGWVLISVVGNPLFARWAKLVGEEAWLTDPRFESDATRGDHSDLLSERMQAWTIKRTTQEVLGALEDARIPCGEVLNLQQALLHEQVRDMNYLVDTHYPGLDQAYPQVRLPLEFSGIPHKTPLRAPLLGEHTSEVLAELGFSESEIAGLKRSRIV